MLYISQGRFTREAIRGMMAKPEDRTEAVAALAESAGGRLLHYYVTFGDYDFLAVFEGPDDVEPMLSALIVAAASGGVSDLRTTPALTMQQFKSACDKAGKMAASFKAAGGVS